MILQALKGYYDRKAQDPDSALAPEGWIAKGIDYVIVLEEDGRIVGIRCLQPGEGKNKKLKMELVPYVGKQALKHNNSGKDANLLWDNSGFVFGLGGKGETKISSFLETIANWFPGSDDKGISAVCACIKHGIKDRQHFQSILRHPEYGEAISSGNPTVTFRLAQDEMPIFLRPTVKNAYETAVLGSSEAAKVKGVCLVSGFTDVPIEASHTVIKGVWGGQSSGGAIVSFNKDSFSSFGKSLTEKNQWLNATVSKSAAGAYVKALNYLLDSKQRLQVGDTSTIFWAGKPSELEAGEYGLADLFGEPDKKDDPDRNTKAVESLLKAIQNGALGGEAGATSFFVLGLAPNAARISVRFWQVGTVAELAGRISQHFDDLAIIHAPHEKPYLSLFRLLVNTAALGKSENIPPNLAGETMRAILAGLPYPATLLQAVVRRIRAEQSKKDERTGKPIPHVNYPRAALIKACINRSAGEEELKVSLDESNTNIGYRLGRLFAALERIQQDAAGGPEKINATIRDRFYSSASSTPMAVFSTLMRLSQHHMSSLRKARYGQFVERDKLLGQIMKDGIEGSIGFPPTLSLADQGRFSIGYYHQRQSFFTK